MKRKIDIIILLLCMVLTSGCVWESYAPEEGKGDANIGMELSTYAVNSGDANALEHELIIKKAYVFIYNAAGVLENAGKTKVSTLTSTGEVIDAAKKLNATWRVIGGNKDIYVVVNPGRIMSERLEHPAIFSDKTTLENVVINEEAFAEDVSAFADSGMVMTTKISAFAVSSDTTVQAVVKRRHGRIDLSVRKAKDLEGATVIVKSVKLKKGQTHMTDLFDFADHLTGAGRHFEETKSMTDTVTAQQATAGSWSGTASDYTAITRFYTFEYHKNGPTDTLSACLEMTVSVNGVDKVIPVYICTTAQGANQTGNDANKPVWVKANTIYRVMATLTKGTVDVALNILDWNDQPINGDIPGHYFNASRNKIDLMIADGASYSTTFDLRASDTISFIEYEYEGTTSIDGSNLPAWLPAANITGMPSTTGTSKTATIGVTGVYDDLAIKKPVYIWFRAGNIKKRIQINCTNYVFEVAAPASGYVYSGETKQYQVTSYKVGDAQAPVEWTAVEFSTDGGTTWSAKPSCITAFTESGAGSTTATPYNAALAKSIGTNVHNTTLQTATSVSNYDLSTNEGTTQQNTANCYIVNAPGTYSLPLVYGNAISADTVNTSAFKPEVGLNPFFGAKGVIPDDGKIADATNAVLVWQDAKELVSVTAALSGTYPNQKLTFTVPAANICQGNAVVAVRNASNEVLWSWHIWVTDYKLTDPAKSFENAANVTYSFMPVNLGWCDPTTYPARSIKVRFTQEESGTQKIMTLNQLAGQENIGNSPYYQWGRKDPFVGALAGVNKTWYNAANPSGTTADQAVASWPVDNSATTAQAVIQNGILNPGTYCTNSSMDGFYYNLWDADYSVYIAGDPVVKSVYDPSPAGYHVPNPDAFTGFSAAASSSCDPTTQSWTFSKNGNTIYFPAVGTRGYAFFVATNVCVGSNYWSAVAGSLGSGCTGVAFYGGVVYLSDGNLRSWGFPVRPVRY